MSHISLYEAHERRDLGFATPHPRERGRTVKDFVQATPPTRNFISVATPCSRRIVLGTDLVAEIEEEEHSGELQDLQGRTWKIHNVSPLFGYTMSLNNELAEYIESRLSVDQSLLNPGDQLDVRVETVRGLRGTREDSDCLRVQIIRKIHVTDAHTTLCTAYFLAIHSQEVDLKSTVTVLPLCLAQGPERILQSVFLMIERLFDCVIHPLNLNPIDLNWMTALWSGTKRTPDYDDPTSEDVVEVSEDKKDLVKMRFRLPTDIPNSQGLENIDVKFNGGQIRSFWNRLKTDRDTEMSVDDMERFHAILQKHMKETLGINFESLILTNIALPILSAAQNGQVRIERLDKIKTILGFLTALCQEKFVSTANPRIGVTVDGL